MKKKVIAFCNSATLRLSPLIFNGHFYASLYYTYDAYKYMSIHTYIYMYVFLY